MCVFDSIKIENFSLQFPHKLCFEGFSARIAFGDRIAIVGQNGSGKSSLLKMIADKNKDLSLAYIPQIIDEFCSLSGGERFNKSLSKALGENPRILLLDEPTNHLDFESRNGLMRMLSSYYGTLIVATHDEEFLQNCVDILWHIDGGKITVFHGKYRDYIDSIQSRYRSVSDQLKILEQERKLLHNKLMQEQKRTSKSKAAGEKKIANKKWMKVTASSKIMKSEAAQGKNLRGIDEKKQKILDQIGEVRLPEVIIPKFNLPYQKTMEQTVVSITDGEIGYVNEKIIAKNINLSVMSHDRMFVVGRNGSGKTTLLKAIMGDNEVVKHGTWYVPSLQDIGYLDQHYRNLDLEKSVVEIIREANPSWSYAEVRRHLNDFLFRKNEEVDNKTCNLSGGEKALLSLAQIAAKIPKLLILDEITNNIDLETRNHLIEILRDYPSAMILVSHDRLFLEKIFCDSSSGSCFFFRIAEV